MKEKGEFLLFLDEMTVKYPGSYSNNSEVWLDTVFLNLGHRKLA